DWPECQRNLDIPDVLLPFIYAAGDHRVMTRMFNRGDFAMEWELPDVGLADLDEEFDSEHALKVCSDVQFALCAYLMRKEVARVLDTGSGGLLTTCCELYCAIGLEDMMGTVGQQLQDECEEIVQSLSSVISPVEREDLVQQLGRLSERMSRENVSREAQEQIESNFMGDSDIAFPGDTNQGFIAAMIEWAGQGCPVVGDGDVPALHWER